jgi:hypothetical protein
MLTRNDIYSIWYYLRFQVIAVVLVKYYLWIRGHLAAPLDPAPSITYTPGRYHHFGCINL